jgi:hypothetical protein
MINKQLVFLFILTIVCRFKVIVKEMDIESDLETVLGMFCQPFLRKVNQTKNNSFRIIKSFFNKTGFIRNSLISKLTYFFLQATG